MIEALSILKDFAPSAGLSSSFEPSYLARSRALHFRENPYLQAPMAGVSDAAYRLMSRAGGAALAYTEMVSVNGLHYQSDKTWELVVPHEAEPDIAVQLFGAEPQLFAEAAETVAKRLGTRLALIDINMACPVPKVVRNGAGSALLDEPRRAAAIVEACRRAVGDSIPITAKIRSGRRTGEDIAVRFADALVSAGVGAIALHGRSAQQMYTGSADWNIVREVAEAVEVAVIGSGDVRSARDAVTLLRTCGCAAVMVARGGYGNPWIFSQAQQMLAAKPYQEPSIVQKLAALECHLRLLNTTGAHMARGRSLCGWYLRGLPHAAQWRNVAMSCITLDDYLHLIAALHKRLASSCEEAS